MKVRSFLAIVSALLIVGVFLAACTPPASSEPCMFAANEDLTVYRLPDVSSGVFGTMSSGDTYEALAQTADGWVGFDPGVAQAGNVGLARHRWILLNATVSPSCLANVEVVTLAEVQADVDASGG